MRKIIAELLCIMLILTGCIGCEMVPEQEKIYTVIPKTDEQAPSVTVISLIGARSLYNGYNFAATSYKPSIKDVWEWNDKETIVVKEWDGYYYSKHMITEYPELFFYVFYDKHYYSNSDIPTSVYCYFVIPISSDEVSTIQVGDPDSKLLEQYGSFLGPAAYFEVVHSDGEILFCRIDRIDGEFKIIEVRPCWNEKFAPMIKEILEFEATLE